MVGSHRRKLWLLAIPTWLFGELGLFLAWRHYVPPYGYDFANSQEKVIAMTLAAGVLVWSMGLIWIVMRIGRHWARRTDLHQKYH